MSDAIKVGLFRGIGGPFSVPEKARRFAGELDARNYESLWAGEHIVLTTQPAGYIPPKTRMPDLIVLFSHLAAVTSRLRFCTGVVNLPHHEPLHLAKQIATLDLLSDGRVILGVGLGGSLEEYAALGIPLAGRGARANEYIDALRALWTMEEPHFEGSFVSFSEIDAHPRPVQPGGVPIVIGGTSRAAYRRAVERGNGWFGFGLDVDGTAACLAGLEEAANSVERPPYLGELEVSIAVRGPLDQAVAAKFAELGVRRLVAMLPAGIADDAFLTFLDEHAPEALFPG